MRESPREIERRLDGLRSDVPTEPPQDWMHHVPRELWNDPVEALRHFMAQVDEAENQ